MSKKRSLLNQFVESLKSLACYGQSRHLAKQQKIALTAQDIKESRWSPVVVDGIYSYATMKSYITQCARFASWVKENFAIKDIKPAKAYVSYYLQDRINKGDSAWTLQLIRSALRKAYQDNTLTDELSLPIRKKNEIKRSRGEKEMDKKFSPERNRDLVDFCKATGLRRHEVKAVKVQDVYRDEDGKLRVEVHRGKGGRPRSVPVLQDLENRVLEIVSGKDLDSQIIEKIPVRADIHAYRRDYAFSYYKELTGKDFDSTDKDTQAIQFVSWALGHNRTSVVTRNYLS